MEELFELRRYIEQQRYADALVLIGEMEEMSRDDKLNKIASYLEVLLLHLIKKRAENRTTRSWELSIRNSVTAIQRINKRRKAGGWYLSPEELAEATEEVYDSALGRAALEVFEGQYSEAVLADKVERTEVIRQALQLVQPPQNS